MADTIRGLTDEQLADYEQRAEQAMLTALESVMATIAKHLGATRTAAAALVAHLPGKHDQRTHGRRGGKVGKTAGGTRAKGRNLTGDAGKLARKAEADRSRYVIEDQDGVVANDPLMHSLAVQQGFDGPPRIVSRDEMDRLVAGGGTEMFRGTKSTDTKTSTQIAEELRTGDAFYGLGVWGNGMYFGSQDHATRFSDKQPGSVVRVTLDRSARVGDYDSISRDSFDAFNATRAASPENRLFDDVGRFAMTAGYDAYTTPEGSLVVLNRTALIVQEA